jgi:eukaryotic-like serine/threonine-protein kinase
MLKDAGFDENNIKRVDASQPEPVDSEKGDVLVVDPDEGSTVAVDTQITLTVATGESKVPLLMGKTADVAEQDAQAAGFQTKIKTVENNDNPEGLVIAQSIDPGKLAERGTTIEISVAKHTQPSPSPTPTTSAPTAPTQSPPATGGNGKGNGNGDGNG